MLAEPDLAGDMAREQIVLGDFPDDGVPRWTSFSTCYHHRIHKSWQSVMARLKTRNRKTDELSRLIV